MRLREREREREEKGKKKKGHRIYVLQPRRLAMTTIVYVYVLLLQLLG